MGRSNIEKLRAKGRAFGRTPEGYLCDLQMSLSFRIIQGLKKKRWSYKTLAKKTGLSEKLLLNIVGCGDYNITLDKAAKLLHAVKVKAEFKV